ncbi:MAG: ABC transporter ATP-binding protein [Candidatus Omnitrophota bacterium]|nr:ABC transporter ATP-binding protein [Candidatus Omnitrophota bacterium]
MNILEVMNLKTYFYTSQGILNAVDGVNFNIEKGKVFGIVGESGSGKTLTALSILKLVSFPGKVVDGQALFNGIDLLKTDEGSLKSIRGAKISFVFQEPSSSFNPVFTIGEQIIEAILAHKSMSKAEAKARGLEYLKKARIADYERVLNDYPHQLSGGTKQRAMIAMALVNSPELVILDEPTTALDVTTQAQILDMLDGIIHKENLSILFISHDFGVISRMCDDVGVMHKGKIVEVGPVREVLNNPKDAYTISLLSSVKALS